VTFIFKVVWRRGPDPAGLGLDGEFGCDTAGSIRNVAPRFAIGLSRDTDAALGGAELGAEFGAVLKSDAKNSAISA